MAVNEWYSDFLSKRVILPKRQFDDSISEGFAINIGNLHHAKLQHDATYRFNAYFCDLEVKQFFGCPHHSDFKQPSHNDCQFDELIFFHCPRGDDKIVIVLEVVEESFSQHSSRTIGWGFIRLGERNTPLPTLGQVPREFEFKRLKLHPGSPKVLLFNNIISEDVTVSGFLEYNLFYHPSLSQSFDFVPDFCILGRRDDVPGLQRSKQYEYQLTNPRLQPQMGAFLDEIGVSFGPNAKKIEEIILEDVNMERMNVENRLNMDGAITMQVLERRLRIGVHNGYTFLFDPIVVHLSSIDQQISGTHSLRRKGTLSRSYTDIRTEMNTLFVRSKVSIPNLCEDPRMTIVFALDYLMGSQTTNNKYTQSVIICWGAWKPFVDDSWRERGRIHGTVALIGGSRPNPDESLVFKNLLNMYKKDDSIFTETAPKISIQFNFSVDDGRQLSSQASHLPREVYHEEQNIKTTPTPRREPTRPVVSPPKAPPLQHMSSDSEEEFISDRLPVISANTKDKPEAYWRNELDRMLLDKEEKMTPRENVASSYEIPWKESRVAPVSRSFLSSLAKEKFHIILDRNGKPPNLIDVAGQVPNTTVEEYDRLDTNEIILQFMAFRPSNRPEAAPTSKIFITTNFYRFTELVTEELLIGPQGVLRRLDTNGQIIDDSAGFTAKFIVDRQSARSATGDEFVSYLQHDCLVIDVWDSESLILLGTIRCPLKCLLRNGLESVQAIVQCPVVSSSIPQQKTISGTFIIKLAAVGHPSSNQIDMVNSRSTALVTRRLRRLGEEGAASYRILAKPLNPVHEDALQRFLHAQRIDIQQRYQTIFDEESQERIQEWKKLKNSIPLSAQKATYNKFIYDEQLEAYRKLRNENKTTKLLQAVFQGITLRHHLYTSVGERNFFEYLLQNSFNEPINCIIEIDEKRLSIVTDTEEWAFLKRRHALSTPLEKNMFQSTKEGVVEVFLKPMESVYVPFIFDNFQLSNSKSPEETTTETKVLFRRWDNGEPVSILDLRVEHRPACFSQTIRFYAEQGTQCMRNILIDEIRPGHRVASVRCLDATSKVSNRSRGTEQELVLSSFCGSAGTSRSIVVFLYSDSYLSKLLATWKIVIHSLERKDVRSSMGQTSKLNLVFNRSEPTNQLIQVFTDTSRLRPINQQFLTSNQLVQIPLSFSPDFTGRKTFVCTAVDSTSKDLLHAWMVSAKSEAPNVTKRFEMKIKISANSVVMKRITISNPYSIPCSFHISSSQSDLLTITDENIKIAGNSSQSISLVFRSVVKKPLSTEILLFIQNNETGQEEETYALQVTYVE